MSYGTIQETPPATGCAQVRFAPDTLPPAASPTHADEDASSERQDAPLLERAGSGLKSFYERNFGLFLVFLAQTCGSVMNIAAKLLANDPSIKFHALQIIFIRMLCTSIICSIYSWYKGIPDFPFGQRGIRWLLVLRGTAGFLGLFGLYYSLSWLEIADATVITFIVPTTTAIVCFLWLREPFTWKEALCSLIAFTGVLFVARPPWLFPQTHRPSSDDPKVPVPSVSPEQRALAILAAIVGTLGASMAYATIRVIGKRAHSLISVNYFSVIATLVSFIIIMVHPDLHFVFPKTILQWGFIAIIGVFGFLLQFLLTEGLQREKGGRATNLTYVQLVFALIVERLIWGTTPPVESLAGAVLIIAAAVAVSLQKEASKGEIKVKQVEDEERRLLENQAD
ncbi:hypothetical protein COCMIDRAFT_2485 [Bipolaris oryzae ATCC 44560]|uniref:EamA domain-containing protein n=1 Tax=Bipolaris oryzae ATCC 44560 TaxID=930090 RepID=W6ZFD2_COCMI|nr:uncharacterized protein COCMIDRAFT_2485 [Bipolaris oryzae ATCC 44560]EUC48618.1 hypothetical protein COCMIDRAFT_2485 [Bipolaris oryzae ATCC 44560]